MKYPVYILLSFLLVQFTSCKKNSNTISVDGKRIHIEIADTPSKRAIGLSGRDSLPKNHGLLFIFPKASKQCFWMKGCKFNIDLAYIDTAGKIKEIITMEKEPLSRPPKLLKRYPSTSKNIKYALEMKGGWFKNHNIKIGTKVNLDRCKIK